ncbi:hypothetical protein SAMN02799630_00441 [Paenibacillus sp. UNCCL117]|uniref:hypothetical protein n=1 Tax=unclassified Paenibacillus TaxID=185978 RepID=UPI0008903AE8|nr:MULTISPECIES: hypothetical protein [unclassified Paenibacillus]SDC40048.1 hypothetical protein SAMN04488602_10291 [Paenibacillus sp. cl123]SFW13910.1 hypothetical protein SAMN02799630_00441 [Paenibacillus sp. UNCCL117]
MNIESNIVLSKQAESALRFLEQTLRPSGAVWAVGGSTGLLLQGGSLAAQPRDLDIYADEADAKAVHAALRHYAVDEQEHNETPIYRSLLSHYEIEGVSVELVGAFEVHACASQYVVETRLLLQRAAALAPASGGNARSDSDGKLRLMPLVHELIFNVLRDRPDRYEIAAALCRQTAREAHCRLLEELTARNRFADPVRERLRALLGAEKEEEVPHEG